MSKWMVCGTTVGQPTQGSLCLLQIEFEVTSLSMFGPNRKTNASHVPNPWAPGSHIDDHPCQEPCDVKTLPRSHLRAPFRTQKSHLTIKMFKEKTPPNTHRSCCLVGSPDAPVAVGQHVQALFQHHRLPRGLQSKEFSANRQQLGLLEDLIDDPKR